MERTTTWANIGTDVTNSTKIISGIPSDMIFDVRKEPMGYMDNGDFKRVKGTSTIVDEFGRAYGPVSDNYGIITNEEALSVIEYVDGFEMKKYGALNNGMQFIIGSLGEMNILGDKFTPYLIFRNSFNGRYPLQMAICPLRIVCQNQLNLAFREADNTVNIRHTAKASSRIEEAHRIMLSTNDYLKELNKQAERYATIKLSDADITAIMKELFPITENMTDRQKRTVEDRIAQFNAAKHSADLSNFKGTVWGIIQAYADFTTHQTIQRETKTAEENRFMAVTFDPKMMANFMRIVNARVGIAA